MLKYITILSLVLLYGGCKNMAYNTVAKDTKPSERNQKLMLIVCNRLSPCKPGKISSDTVETIVLDTVQNQSLQQTLQELVNYINNVCIGPVDTAALDSILRAGIKPCVNEKRVIRIHDSIPYQDDKPLKQMQYELDDKTATLLFTNHEKEVLKTSNDDLKHRVFSLWCAIIGLGLILVGYVAFRIYQWHKLKCIRK